MSETYEACIALGRSLGFEEEHSLQDARLALLVFDLLADVHRMDDECRELLRWAALLHDIGYAEGYWGHHKTAYRRIMAAELPGMTTREKRIVANVARYHRGARPRLDHPGFAELDREEREIVTMLGAILRLADGLDRSHTQAVEDLDLWLDAERLVVIVDCASDCSAEVWAGEKKGQWLGDVLGVELQVRQRTAAETD